MNETGLIYGYYLNESPQAQPIEKLSELNLQESYWLHFDYTFKETAEWLEQHSGLNPVVVSALLNEETRPRASFIDQGILISLRGVNLSPNSNPEDMVSIRIWVDKQRVISTRCRPLLSARSIADELAEGKGPTTPTELVAQIATELISRMANTINDIEDQLERLEEKMIDKNTPLLRHDVVEVRRQVIALKRYLSPQREAMQQMLSEKQRFFNNNEHIEIREAMDNLIRYIEDLDAIRDKASVVQEEIANRLNEQLNSRMYVLSIITAVFLPLGFFTGLFGINVGGLPGIENDHAFTIFAGVLIALLAIQIWVFKKNKWF